MRIFEQRKGFRLFRYIIPNGKRVALSLTEGEAWQLWIRGRG